MHKTKKPTIEDWELFIIMLSDKSAAECVTSNSYRIQVKGHVYNHASYHDGCPIKVSKVQHFDPVKGVLRDDKDTYKLGKPNADYAAALKKDGAELLKIRIIAGIPGEFIH